MKFSSQFGKNAVPGICQCNIGICNFHLENRLESNVLTFHGKKICNNSNRVDLFTRFLQSKIFGSLEKPSEFKIQFNSQGKPTNINLMNKHVDRLIEHHLEFISLMDEEDQIFMALYFKSFIAAKKIWNLGVLLSFFLSFLSKLEIILMKLPQFPTKLILKIE